MPRSSELLAALALALGACKDASVSPPAASSASPSPRPEDPSAPAPQRAFASPPAATARPDTVSTAGGAGMPVAIRRPHGSPEDGAPTPSAVFERAEKAFSAKDYAVVFHTVAPATRKGWLGGMVFAGEFATMGRMSEQGARRAALDELRTTLDKYGATLSVEQRLAGLT